MITINKKDVQEFPIKYINYMSSYCRRGREPYKLYAYMSHLFNGINIFDVGTYKGDSALALADNKYNFVYSFDILDQRTMPSVKNVSYVIDDFSLWLWCTPALVLIDVALHDGILEKIMLDKLKKCIILFDDIHFNDGMKKFWGEIPYEKYDLIEIGHFSGTGLVNLADERIEII